MMADFIGSIFESEILKQITSNISTYLHSIITNQLLFMGVIILISFGIGYFISTKLLTKASIIITLTILIYFFIRYIGIS